LGVDGQILLPSHAYKLALDYNILTAVGPSIKSKLNI
jgi:hypothetical protein